MEKHTHTDLVGSGEVAGAVARRGEAQLPPSTVPADPRRRLRLGSRLSRQKQRHRRAHRVSEISVGGGGVLTGSTGLEVGGGVQQGRRFTSLTFASEDGLSELSAMLLLVYLNGNRPQSREARRAEGERGGEGGQWGGGPCLA